MMQNPPFSPAGHFDEEVIRCLKCEMIPVWERYGMERLAASAGTLREFLNQPLPAGMRVWQKKRKSRKAVTHRGPQHNNRIVRSWPQDDQESIRFPVLIYVRSGEAEFQTGDYVTLCPREHFLLLRPGVPQPAGSTPHLEEPRHGKKCEIWWFHSTGNDDFVALSVCYSVEERHINSGHYYIVSAPRIAQLFNIFAEEMGGEVDDPASEYRKTGFAVLQAFLLLFLREMQGRRFYNRGVDNLPKSAPATASPIEMARQYIDKNLNHPLTMDVVAQAVFMARTNFARQFREETGQTFCEYLTARRMEEARHWLLRESCSIDVVCRFVGLKSSRFHQLFKQRFGMTPTEFRRQHKNV